MPRWVREGQFKVLELGRIKGALQAKPYRYDFNIASKSSGCDAVCGGFQDGCRYDKPPECSHSNHSGCHMRNEEFPSDYDSHDPNLNEPYTGRISTLP
jgi:hypothetical protein